MNSLLNERVSSALAELSVAREAMLNPDPEAADRAFDALTAAAVALSGVRPELEAHIGRDSDLAERLGQFSLELARLKMVLDQFWVYCQNSGASRAAGFIAYDLERIATIPDQALLGDV